MSCRLFIFSSVFQVCRGDAEAAGERGRGREAGVRGRELPPGAGHHQVDQGRIRHRSVVTDFYISVVQTGFEPIEEDPKFQKLNTLMIFM